MKLQERYPGLFEGELEVLLSQKRHTDRALQLLFATVTKESVADTPDPEKIRKATEYAMTQRHWHALECVAFIEKWGEEIVLKTGMLDR